MADEFSIRIAQQREREGKAIDREIAGEFRQALQYLESARAKLSDKRASDRTRLIDRARGAMKIIRGAIGSSS